MSRSSPRITTWIFDLDNTLYPARSNLFDLVDARMTAFIADRLGLDPDAARGLQKRYFRAHGTTLAGLMRHHDVDPHEFLAYVHAVPLDRIAPDPALAARIERLSGRKLVFTNGDADYAARVLDRLGLASAFDGIHDILAMELRPKPDPAAYASLYARWSVEPARALFVDDLAGNLAPAKALGMTTVWLDNGSEQGDGHDRQGPCPAFVDERIDDLGAWLDHYQEGLA